MEVAVAGDPSFARAYRATREARLGELAELALADTAAGPQGNETAVAPSHLPWFTPALLRLCMAAEHGAEDEGAQHAAHLAAVYEAALQDPRAQSLLAYEACDFDAIEADLKAAVAPWAKMSPGRAPSPLGDWDVLGFESRWTPAARIRFVVLEVLRLAVIADIPGAPPWDGASAALLTDPSYVGEVGACLLVALTELPQVITAAQVVRATLPYHGAHAILLWLSCNLHEDADAICATLLQLAEATPIQGQTKPRGPSQPPPPPPQQQQQQQQCTKALSIIVSICSADRARAIRLRQRLVSARRLPELVLQLTVAPCEDTVVFLSSVLTDRKGCDFLLSYISKAGASAGANGIVSRVRMLVLDAICERDSDTAAVAVAVRVATLLFSQTNLPLAPEEVRALLRALSAARSGPQAGRISQLGLCLLLSCQSFTMHCEEDDVRKLLEHLAEQLSAHGHSDWMLLLASHFHQQALSAVARLFRTTVQTTFQINSVCMKRVRDICVLRVIPEKALVAQAMRVPVTQGLGARMGGTLPLHCVYNLIKTRTLVKHGVSARAWILAQTLAAHPTDDIHPILPSLLRAFADFVVEPLGTAESDNVHPPRAEDQAVFRRAPPMEGFSEDDILGTLLAPEQPDTVQCLAVLYVLCVAANIRRRLVRGRPSFVTSGDKGHACPRPWPARVIRALPVKRVLKVATEHPRRYSAFGGSLTALISDQFPELFGAEDLLAEGNTCTHRWLAGYCDMAPSAMGLGASLAADVIRRRQSALSDAAPFAPSPASRVDVDAVQSLLDDVAGRPTEAACGLEYLLGLSTPALRMWASADRVSALAAQMSAPGTQHRLRTAFLRLWNRVAAEEPRALWAATITGFGEGGALVTYDALVENPLLTLRVIPREVCDSAPLMTIVLTILRCLLVASEAAVAAATSDWDSPNAKAHGAETLASQRQERQRNEGELVAALVLAQRAAAVQLLLELCLEALPARGDNLLTQIGSAAVLPDDLRPEQATPRADLAAVRSLICEFIHQQFIADMAVARLVHLQGYDHTLLPMAVHGIPSLHVCLDFVREMLLQPELQQQIFAVRLTAALAETYRLPKTLEVCRAILGHMHEMATSPAAVRWPYYRGTLPSLIPLCKAFPLLGKAAVELMMQLRSLERREASFTPIAVGVAEKSAAARFVDTTLDGFLKAVVADGLRGV